MKIITEQHVQGNTTITGLNPDVRETSLLSGTAEALKQAVYWVEVSLDEAIEALPPDGERIYSLTIYADNIRINAHHRSEQ